MLAENRLSPPKAFKLFNSSIQLLPVCILILILIACDTDPTLTPPVRHTVEINDLTLTNQTVEAGGTTTITVMFDYSGDEADLIFRWEASSGEIIGDASSVTYVTSDIPGTHKVTLQLTDGFATVERAITVEVLAQQSLLIATDTYWAGQGNTLVLQHQVNVTQILHQPVILQYDIVQDASKTGAFLNVDVDGVLLVEEEAIGEVDPPDRITITGELDVSQIITAPGRYNVTLTLVAVNAIERGWLLERAALLGAEGSAVQLQ
ncbi:hypothetical protein F4X33_06680 [Candidatus Poribacteria bacterium]|nr:hypothetical protein [Candidatus Poribacteria bacterium]